MLSRFSTPGGLEDFQLGGSPLSDQQITGWSALIAWWLEEEIALVRKDVQVPPMFFNESVTVVPPDAVDARIVWDAFPRVLSRKYDPEQANPARARAEAEKPQSLSAYYNETDDRQVYEYVDGRLKRLNLTYRNQDEYCEWYAVRNPQNNRLEKLIFTAEGPEYWEFIAGGTLPLTGHQAAVPVVPGDRQLLLHLYRTYVSPDVQLEDLFFQNPVVIADRDGKHVQSLFPKDSYNPYNVWNSRNGIMHLTHPANTLRAEIQLAGDATVLRHDVNGAPIVDAMRLICCSGFGAVNRSSDPTIGSEVNSLVRQEYSVTLKDPIGIYIDQLDLSAFEGPDGEDVSDCWHILRGSPGRILRAELRVPDGKPFSLEQISIAGEPLRSGAQVAEHIKVALYGRAFRSGQAPPASRPCSRHCCTSQANRSIMEIVSGDTDCSSLNRTGRTWTESFPELTEAHGELEVALNPDDLAPAAPLVRRGPP